ncbi:hypothetical protein [Chryseobacterium sp.]|uniref:hypothetical protein n=1 Tax=Chryseobacterium sp. TaxID=1871047 RepID=UPI0025BA1AB3|nr:hypothetical protein [Chryseobacterium sp.]
MDTSTNANTAATTTAVKPTTPAEKSAAFVNEAVLSPPATSPMTGASAIMKDQATGMMVQDLQSFLKGFEQLGLIAISRLANNILTYGTYHHKPSLFGEESGSEDTVLDKAATDGNEVIRDLFKIVSDYAEVKSKISSGVPTGNEKTGQSENEAPANEPLADPEKKND